MKKWLKFIIEYYVIYSYFILFDTYMTTIQLSALSYIDFLYRFVKANNN